MMAKKTKQWWEDKDLDIGCLENTDTGVTNVVARQVDGEWEYAVVFWRVGTAWLMGTLKGGKLVSYD